MKWSRWGHKGRGPAAGMRVKGGRSQSRPVKWTGRRTAEGLPGIGQPGRVPSTHPQDQWPRSMECEGQLKTRGTVLSVAWQLGMLVQLSKWWWDRT